MTDQTAGIDRMKGSPISALVNERKDDEFDLEQLWDERRVMREKELRRLIRSERRERKQRKKNREKKETKEVKREMMNITEEVTTQENFTVETSEMAEGSTLEFTVSEPTLQSNTELKRPTLDSSEILELKGESKCNNDVDPMVRSQSLRDDTGSKITVPLLAGGEENTVEEEKTEELQEVVSGLGLPPQQIDQDVTKPAVEGEEEKDPDIIGKGPVQRPNRESLANVSLSSKPLRINKSEILKQQPKRMSTRKIHHLADDGESLDAKVDKTGTNADNNSELRSRIKSFRCTIRFLTGVVVVLLVFIFFQVGIRMSSPIKVSRDGILQAMRDPFGINTVDKLDSPLQVSEFGSKLGSILDIHDMTVDQLESIKTVRFAVYESDDVVIHSESVSSASRSNHGSVTTINFVSGTVLVIDERLEPPFQVMFERDGRYFRILVTYAIVGSTELTSSKCMACPIHSQLIGFECVCEPGFTLSDTAFGCVQDLQGSVGVSGIVNSGSCIGNITLSNVTIWTNATNFITHTNVTIGGPGNAWGGKIDLPDKYPDDPTSFPRQSSPYQGTDTPRCAQNWVYTDETNERASPQRNVTLSGCVSIFEYYPKTSGRLIRTLLGEVDLEDYEYPKVEWDVPNKSIMWCPREDMSDYHKQEHAANNPPHTNLLWGLCVPCPETTESPTKLPSPSPTTAPVLPTSAPVLPPTSVSQPSHMPTQAPQPTAAPIRKPSSAPTKSINPTTVSPSPTMSPTSNPSGSLTWTNQTCIPAACQVQDITHSSASDFCTTVMDMKLCSADQLRSKIERFWKLLRSDDEEIQKGAYSREFSCFASQETSKWIWTSSRDLCGTTGFATVDLAGNVGCSESKEKGSVICCEALSLEDQESQLADAEDQISTGATVNIASTSIQYSHLRKQID